jgi:hypothetical protein
LLTPRRICKDFLLNFLPGFLNDLRLRIPGDADQRSEVMAIAIPN